MPVSPSPTATPFGLWDLGGCNCATVKIIVAGCAQLGYPGLTVQVYASSGGALLYSGTTDSGGAVDTGIRPSGTYYVVITGQGARWQSYAQAVSLTSSRTVYNSLPLVAATGYGCIASCLQPAAGTLHYTGPAGTLTLNGSGTWQDSGFTVQFSWSAGPTASLYYFATGFRYSDSTPTCPIGLSASFADGSTVTE